MRDDFYRRLLDNMFDGVYFVDTKRRITFWNKGAERITGYQAEEVVGRSCANNILRHVTDAGKQLCVSGCPLEGTIKDGLPREAEVYLHHKNGQRIPVLVKSAPIHDEHGNIIGAVEIFSENFKSVYANEKLRELEEEVFKDPLTGIGNRMFATMHLENLISNMERHGVPFGLLFVDIDHFKNINDTYGHNVGDDILRMTAKTLANGLRPADQPCRWGGEEFLLMLPNVSRETLAAIAERLRILVERSWLDHEGKNISVTISLGGTISAPGDDVESVVQRADQQLYHSKQSGRNQVTLD